MRNLVKKAKEARVHLMRGKTTTGIYGLDRSLRGGLPRGDTVIVSGRPGSGKTILCGEFLYKGAAECSENGLYVSFSEGRETFKDNMLRLGFDFNDPELQGSVEILDFISVKEKGLDPVIETIVNKVDRNSVERLVIDPYSAMVDALPSVIDVRVTTHILTRLMKQTGCTTLLVTCLTGETGKEERVGVEGAISDGVILLKRGNLDGSTLRTLEIPKMRGTEIQSPYNIFTIHRGIKVLSPMNSRATGQLFSRTPSPNMRVGGAGLRKFAELFETLNGGETVLVEIERDTNPKLVELLFVALESVFRSVEKSSIPPLYGGNGWENRDVGSVSLHNNIEETQSPTDVPSNSTISDSEQGFHDAQSYIPNWFRRDHIHSEVKGGGRIRFLDLTGGLDSRLRHEVSQFIEAVSSKSDSSKLVILAWTGLYPVIDGADCRLDACLRLKSVLGVPLVRGIYPWTNWFALQTRWKGGDGRLSLVPMM